MSFITINKGEDGFYRVSLEMVRCIFNIGTIRKIDDKFLFFSDGHFLNELKDGHWDVIRAKVYELNAQLNAELNAKNFGCECCCRCKNETNP